MAELTSPMASESSSRRRRTLREGTRDERPALDGSGAGSKSSAKAWLWSIGLGTAAVLGALFFVPQSQSRPNVTYPARGPIPKLYSPERAESYLKAVCDLGPRPSGSRAMVMQQDMLEEYFKKCGGTVRRQEFETRHPENGSAVPMTNLIVTFYPDRPKRFLFCAHYDTRPYPDRDKRNKRGVFVGANDGGSGTAGLMELANHTRSLPDNVGVDLVLFDGEEFVWRERRDRYFIGSTYFAEDYKNNPPEIPYEAGVLFDMIGDKELKIYYEGNSLRYAKPVARSFWKTAQRLGVNAFVMRQRHEIRDDHLPLNQIAGIPTIDVIDFDYPRPGIGAPSYWHTEQDVVENCSGTSIAAVVWVAHEWLLSQGK